MILTLEYLFLLCGCEGKSLPSVLLMSMSLGILIYWHVLLQYSQSEDHVLNIVLSAVYTTGWLGIGFSKDGMMVGSSAMVGWINTKGHARIKQYYLQGSKQGQVIPDKGELPLTGVPASVGLNGAMIYLAFQLKFQTQLARQPIILAVGSSYPKNSHLSEHEDKTTIMFDFSAGFFSLSFGSFYIKCSFLRLQLINSYLYNWSVSIILLFAITLKTGSKMQCRIP